MKRQVTVADIEDDVVRYREIDDCYVCGYDLGDKFAEPHVCALTGDTLGYPGKYDIDVPESCPFPARDCDENSLLGAIVSRNQGITDSNLKEIISHLRHDE